MPVSDPFTLAMQHHQAGQLAEAERLYRYVLAQHPAHAQATHLLGVLASQSGHCAAAAQLLRRAVALDPANPEALSNLASVLSDIGEFDEAIAASQQALALRPAFPQAMSNLAHALTVKGHIDKAIALCRRAIALKSDHPQAYCNLGVALHEKGLLEEAIAACRQAVALDPKFANAYNNLGSALEDNGQSDEAIEACSRAVELQPGFAQAINNLGVALKSKGRFDEAIAAHQQAIALRPDFAEAFSNLGFALRDAGRAHEALAACQKAIALKPDYPDAHLNLGIALIDLGRVEEALEAIRTSVRLKPAFADARHALAGALLLQGNFHEGWPLYHWRWKTKEFPHQHRFAQPSWDGSNLGGRTLLVHPEQGFGDVIQFVRYAPLIAERSGGRVMMGCLPELYRLMKSLGGSVELLESGAPLPAFDLHCPLMNLPAAFGTTIETIPNAVPYLRPDADDVEHWRQRLLSHLPISPSPHHFLKVGLAWAGRKEHKNDRSRSLTLLHLAPLTEVEHVQFYSLQKGDPAAQTAAPPAGMRLIDWTSDLNDFADTAALIANLDLVIAVDTSVVHLAGALGKPVWTLLPFAPDWRWMRDRDDSPWYPTMRLFRQPKPGDWKSVVAAVAGQLVKRVMGQ